MHSLLFLVMVASLVKQFSSEYRTLFLIVDAKENPDCPEFSPAYTAFNNHIVAAGFKWISQEKFAAFMMVDGREYLSEDLFKATHFTAQVFLKDAKTIDVVYEEKLSEAWYVRSISSYELQFWKGETVLKLVWYHNDGRHYHYPLPKQYVIAAQNHYYYDAHGGSITLDQGEGSPCIIHESENKFCVYDAQTDTSFKFDYFEELAPRTNVIYCNRFITTGQFIYVYDVGAPFTGKYHACFWKKGETYKSVVYEQVQFWDRYWDSGSKLCQLLGSRSELPSGPTAESTTVRSSSSAKSTTGASTILPTVLFSTVATSTVPSTSSESAATASSRIRLYSTATPLVPSGIVSASSASSAVPTFVPFISTSALPVISQFTSSSVMPTTLTFTSSFSVQTTVASSSSSSFSTFIPTSVFSTDATTSVMTAASIKSTSTAVSSTKSSIRPYSTAATYVPSTIASSSSSAVPTTSQFTSYSVMPTTLAFTSSFSVRTTETLSSSSRFSSFIPTSVFATDATSVMTAASIKSTSTAVSSTESSIRPYSTAATVVPSSIACSSSSSKPTMRIDPTAGSTTVRSPIVLVTVSSARSTTGVSTILPTFVFSTFTNYNTTAAPIGSSTLSSAGTTASWAKSTIRPSSSASTLFSSTVVFSASSAYSTMSINPTTMVATVRSSTLHSSPSSDRTTARVSTVSSTASSNITFAATTGFVATGVSYSKNPAASSTDPVSPVIPSRLKRQMLSPRPRSGSQFSVWPFIGMYIIACFALMSLVAACCVAFGNKRRDKEFVQYTEMYPTSQSLWTENSEYEV